MAHNNIIHLSPSTHPGRIVGAGLDWMDGWIGGQTRGQYNSLADYADSLRKKGDIYFKCERGGKYDNAN